MSEAVRFELADPERQLLEEIADPAMTRRDVALTYGLALRGDQSRVDWPKVNRAVVERWSVSGLKWVKDFAWRAAPGSEATQRTPTHSTGQPTRQASHAAGAPVTPSARTG